MDDDLSEHPASQQVARARRPLAWLAPANWSLATRLTAWYAGSAFALIFCATSLLYIALMHSLYTEADQFLSDRIEDVRTILLNHESAGGSSGKALQDELEEESAPHQHTPIFFRVYDGDRMLAESPGIERLDGVDAFPPPMPNEVRLGTGVDDWSDSGRPYRLLAARIRVGKGDDKHEYTVEAAMDVGQQVRLLRLYRKRLWL